MCSAPIPEGPRPLIHRKDYDGIALLILENPPVNALGLSLRQALAGMIAAIEADTSIRAVVLTGQGKVFVGGADISEFDRPPEAPHLPDLIAAIEGARLPWIAALNGAALGGGAELALGCAYRILAPSARLALPETSLGILPGAGGTQRLPRLIGPGPALEVITGGAGISAERALEIGLADRVETGDLISGARDFARSVALQSSRPTPAPDRPIEDPGADFWQAAEARITKAARGNPGPAAALAAIREGVMNGFSAGMALERETFLHLRQSPEAAALRHLFFAERAAPRPAALRGVTPAAFARIGVIGGGTMGSGIAASLANAGLSVVLAETGSEALATGMARIAAIFAAQVKRGLHDQAEGDRRLALVTGVVGLQPLAGCDLVIEAVFEDLAVKRAVFTDLTRICPAHTLLATNTSYLDPESIVAGLPGPERFLGLHFFSPAQVMKLLEIVALKGSSPTTLATGFALAARLGKIPVQAGNCEGFIGNRILKRYRAGAESLLTQGITPGHIDRAMRDFGFGMGPFEMQDMAGLDIAFRAREAARAQGADLPDTPGDLLVRAGRLGQKTGAGWYDYAPGSRSPELTETVARLLAPMVSATPPQDGLDIAEFLVGVMADEGEQILAEGIAQSAAHIDLVEVHGYGFPRHRGGPMFHTARNQTR